MEKVLFLIKISLILIFLMFLSLSSLLTFHSVVLANPVSFQINTVSSAYANQRITVTISANSSAEYNAVSIDVSFSNLSYVASSVVDGWTPVSGPIASGNSISFAGALLGSTASGARRVLLITFQTPNNPGTSSINVTGIVDSTGLGGESYSASASRSIQIISQVTNTPTRSINQTPTTTTTPTPVITQQTNLPGLLNVTSPTHSDQSKWYNNDSYIKLTWNTEDYIGFSFVINQNPNAEPDDIVDTTQNTYEISKLSEGINYFHIKARNQTGWGPTTRFRINIDKTPPYPFSPNIRKVSETGKYIISFNTVDNLSTVRYRVQINNFEPQENANGYIEINTSDLDYLKIEAIDDANNIRTFIYNVSTQFSANTVSEENNSGTNKSQNNTTTNKTIGIIEIITIVMILILTAYSAVISYLYFFGRKKITKDQTSPSAL